VTKHELKVIHINIKSNSIQIQAYSFPVYSFSHRKIHKTQRLSEFGGEGRKGFGKKEGARKK